MKPFAAHRDHRPPSPRANGSNRPFPVTQFSIRNGFSCEGFRMPANRNVSGASGLASESLQGKEPAVGGGVVAVYRDLTTGPRAGVMWRVLKRVVDRRLPPAERRRCGSRLGDFGVTICIVRTIGGHMATGMRCRERRAPAGGRSEEVTKTIMALRS